MKTQQFLRAALGLTVLGIGCAPAAKEWRPPIDRTNFFFPVRQLPPDPTYNRLREVRPPQVLPDRNLRYEGVPIYSPVVHLELKNATLQETAKVLGTTTRYSYYCASSIADKKITVDYVGTAEELARHISEKAGIYARVDHTNKEVRFLANQQEVAPSEIGSDLPFEGPESFAPRMPDEARGVAIDGAIQGSPVSK